jgi:hypothetical protein
MTESRRQRQVGHAAHTDFVNMIMNLEEENREFLDHVNIY